MAQYGNCTGGQWPPRHGVGRQAPFRLFIFAAGAAVGQSDASPLSGSNVVTITLTPLVDLDDSFSFSISGFRGLRTDLSISPVYTLTELWGSASGTGPIALRRGVLQMSNWDTVSFAIILSIRLTRALLASIPSPGYVFSFTVANGPGTQTAPSLSIGPVSGVYTGTAEALVPAAGVSAPIFIRLWTVQKFSQSTARPSSLNKFTLSLVPSAVLPVGSILVITGAKGVSLPSSATVLNPPAAIATQFGVGISLSYLSGSAILGTIGAFEPVEAGGSGILRFLVATRWLAGVSVTVTFNLFNGASPQIPSNITLNATGVVEQKIPALSAGPDAFDAEQCERRPFFINSVTLVRGGGALTDSGVDSADEDTRMSCVQWDQLNGLLTFDIGQGNQLVNSSAVDPSVNNTLNSQSAFRIRHVNGGGAQVARTVAVSVSPSASASAQDISTFFSPPSQVYAGPSSGADTGGPLEIRLWNTAAAAQVTDVPNASNTIAIALSPVVELPTGTVIAITGLNGTSSYFASSLQLACVPPPCLDVVSPAWSWASSTLTFTVGSLSSVVNVTWPANSYHDLVINFNNGALTQSARNLFVEIRRGAPVYSSGSDWQCSSAQSPVATPPAELLAAAAAKLAASGLIEQPPPNVCREPTAQQLAFDITSVSAGLQAGGLLPGIGNSSLSTATAPLSLQLWTDLAASQSSAAPGLPNRLVFQMRASVSLKAGDNVTITGLTGFSTPNSPEMTCTNSSDQCYPELLQPALDNVLPTVASLAAGPTATYCGDGWQPLCVFGHPVWRRDEGTLVFTVRADMVSGVLYSFGLTLRNGDTAQTINGSVLTMLVSGSVNSTGVPFDVADGDAIPGSASASVFFFFEWRARSACLQLSILADRLVDSLILETSNVSANVGCLTEVVLEATDAAARFGLAIDPLASLGLPAGAAISSPECVQSSVGAVGQFCWDLRRVLSWKPARTQWGSKPLVRDYFVAVDL
mmetsp:Transcript_53131/g.140321  ORF Transcript_53131/g.140321 Transcript_53131/m.140321 type:complete len:980 (-) Transcript_53131:523-3462(-)